MITCCFPLYYWIDYKKIKTLYSEIIKNKKLWSDLSNKVKILKSKTCLYDLLDAQITTLTENKKLIPHVITVSSTIGRFLNMQDSLDELIDLLDTYDMLLICAAGNEEKFLSENLKKTFRDYPNLKKRIIYTGATDSDNDIKSTLPGEFGDIFVYVPGKNVSYEENIASENSIASSILSSFLALLKSQFNLDLLTLKNIILETTQPFKLEEIKSFNSLIQEKIEETDALSKLRNQIIDYDNNKILGSGLLDCSQAFKKAKEASREYDKKERDNLN